MAEKVASLYAEIGLQDKGVARGLQDVKKSLDGTSKGFQDSEKKSTSFFDRLKGARGAILGATAAFAALGLAANQAWKLAERGNEIKRAEQALVGYAGSAYEAANALREVQEATDGAISRTDSMAMASRLFAMGLADTSAEAGRLAEIAITLGASMGQGPQAAFDAFSLMLANQSIPRLDTFGISATEVRERMEELVDEGMSPADRQGRFLAATLEVAERKMAELAAAGFDATTGMDELKSAWKDFADEVALRWTEITGPAFEAAAGRLRLGSQIREVEELGLAWKDLGLNVQQYADVTMFYTPGEIQAAIDEYQMLIEVMRGATTGRPLMEDFSKAVVGLDESFEDLGPTLDDVSMALGDVTDKMIFQKLAAGMDAEGALELARAMGLVNEESWAQIEAYNALDASTYGYASRVGDLAMAISMLESKNVTITVDMIQGQLGTIAGARTELSSLPTDIARNLPKRALGGPVEGAGAYWVGEEGPEIFVPRTSGDVIPPTGIAAYAHMAIHESRVREREAATPTIQSSAIIQQIASVPSQVAQQMVSAQTTAAAFQQSMSDRMMQDISISMEDMARLMRDMPRRFAKEITSTFTQVMGG